MIPDVATWLCRNGEPSAPAAPPPNRRPQRLPCSRRVIPAQEATLAAWSPSRDPRAPPGATAARPAICADASGSKPAPAAKPAPVSASQPSASPPRPASPTNTPALRATAPLLQYPGCRRPNELPQTLAEQLPPRRRLLSWSREAPVGPADQSLVSRPALSRLRRSCPPALHLRKVQPHPAIREIAILLLRPTRTRSTPTNGEQPSAALCYMASISAADERIQTRPGVTAKQIPPWNHLTEPGLPFALAAAER